MPTRRGLVATGVAALAAKRHPAALAQDAFPSRPIRVLVPYAAGGGQDITARLLAEPMRAALGQPLVVENRSGASGMIAAQAAAQAAPDGYTLMLGGAGETAINQHLFRGRMAYDPLRDLKPVAVAVKVPNVVMANPAAPSPRLRSWWPTRRLTRASSATPPRASATRSTWRASC